LSTAIDQEFGSLKALNDALVEEAVGHFASGWAWLIAKNGRLAVSSTHDAGTALAEAVVPLLTIDVWEHAYYLDVKNKRPDYVKAVVEHRLNWRFASANYGCDSVWRYPDLVLEQRST
jgi:Fe-Mn family superoxide dismutase